VQRIFSLLIWGLLLGHSPSGRNWSTQNSRELRTKLTFPCRSDQPLHGFARPVFGVASATRYRCIRGLKQKNVTARPATVLRVARTLKLDLRMGVFFDSSPPTQEKLK
jgi:hypothetical protein